MGNAFLWAPNIQASMRIARTSFLMLVLSLCMAGSSFAGSKLSQLKADAKRIQKGTLLVAPILPDSFVLWKAQKKGPEAEQLYRANLAKANENLANAVRAYYQFSKVRILTADAGFKDYPSYFETLGGYKRDSFFVLQFGQAVQFAEGKTKKIRPYEKEFLGVYATDGTTRLYLNVGKVELFYKPDYANMIVQNLQKNLDMYARDRRSIRKPKQRLLVPALQGDVRVVEKERLYGSDSTTFLNRQWQTVVTTETVMLFRVFGGEAEANGSFASTQPVVDSAETRAALAILPAWGNNMRYVLTLSVPEGTKLNVGVAGPQPVPPTAPVLNGGGYQVILPYQWPSTWVTGVRDRLTGQVYTPEEFKGLMPGLWW